MNKEIEYLQNAINSIELTGLSVHEKLTQDKRKSVKQYFVNLENKGTISPTLNYTDMNHFLNGFHRAKKILL
jgi:hypothetical protein